MTSSESVGNPYSHHGFGKRLAKLVLHGLHALLPRSAYQAVYDPAFHFYQALQRRSYARSMRRVRAQDEATLLRRQRVHAVMPYSLVGVSGLEHTDELVCQLIAAGVPGAFVECGVARGGSAALIALNARLASPHRSCWFFDSFEGLPDPSEKDLESGKTGQHIRPLLKGSCLGTLEQVDWLLFEKFRLSREEITLVKGWFQDTLPIQRARIGQIALLRVDGDWYESTRCCLTQLFDQVAPGGVVIIDDYWSCHGARRATDEFLAERGLQLELTPDGRGGMSFVKPRSESLVAAGAA
jgi:predicted O-methyltransferase YrrM